MIAMACLSSDQVVPHALLQGLAFAGSPVGACALLCTLCYLPQAGQSLAYLHTTWHLTAPMSWRLVSCRTHNVLVDLGSGSGASIKQYLQANQAKQQDIQIHAFEPDHWKIATLQTSLRQQHLNQQPAVHEAAVWVTDGMVPYTHHP